MPKKIFDITPPNAFKEPDNFELTSEKKERAGGFSLPKMPKFGIKKFLILIPLLVLIGVFIFFQQSSRAEIKIWVDPQPLNLSTSLVIDTKTKTSDLEKKILPASFFDAEKTISEDFSASGKVAKKAEGVIRLYNAYSPTPEKWLAGTRFVSSNGKLFYSKAKIEVPGAEIKNEKITPSYVDVPVIAAEAGTDYNIEPSNFSVIAFKGTPRYTKFYGESFQAMQGGGEVPQVTNEDLEKAENNLAEKIKQSLKEDLKNRTSNSGFIFLDDIFDLEVIEKNSSIQAGKEAEKFNFSLKAKAKTISLKEEENDSFLQKIILGQIAKEQDFLKDKTVVSYSVDDIDFETGKANLSLKISAKTYTDLDLVSLKNSATGKTISELKESLERQNGIKRVEIKIFPIWLKNIPGDLQKIQISYPLVD